MMLKRKNLLNYKKKIIQENYGQIVEEKTYLFFMTLAREINTKKQE